MEHSIALVTGATSGLGLAAARLLAGEGRHTIIVTVKTFASLQIALRPISEVDISAARPE